MPTVSSKRCVVADAVPYRRAAGQHAPGSSGLTRGAAQQRPAPEVVAFDRSELGIILSLYGRMVAAGEWRDYGLSFLSDVAVFSIFRRTAETPVYRVEKRPRLRNAQGMYSVVGMDGRILRRGHELRNVLRVLERRLIRAVD